MPKTRSAAVLALLAPLTALAHTGVDAGAHHGFVAGFLHPLQGPDHLAAMVGVGLWSALAAKRAWPDLVGAPAGFAAMLLAGALAGLGGVALPAVEPMIAVSLLLIGLLVATRRHLAPPAAAALVGVFALFHGAAHGQELAGQADALPVLAGMLAATVLLHAGGIAAGWGLRHAHRWVPRAIGSAVAVLGVVLLGGLA